MKNKGEITIKARIDEDQVRESARLAADLFLSEYAAHLVEPRAGGGEDADELRKQLLEAEETIKYLREAKRKLIKQRNNASSRFLALRQTVRTKKSMCFPGTKERRMLDDILDIDDRWSADE